MRSLASMVLVLKYKLAKVPVGQNAVIYPSSKSFESRRRMCRKKKEVQELGFKRQELVMCYAEPETPDFSPLSG